MAEAEKLKEARTLLCRQDLDRMVAFLGSQSFRFSHREQGIEGQPHHHEQIRSDIARFVQGWHALQDVVQEILAHPAEALMPEMREVHIRGRYHMTVPVLTRNLREGRVLADPETEGWRPRSDTLWGMVDLPTLDTPENAHVHAVVSAYREMRDTLVLALKEEEREFILQAERMRDYHSEQRRVDLFERQASRAARELQSLWPLQPVSLPPTWESLTSLPNRDNNRTLFDPRYRTVAGLEDQLDQLITPGRSLEARRRLAELGQRRPWELYEYWMVAKTCALLEDLRFGASSPDGFVSLEDARGGAYGLRNGASLTYTHHTSALVIRLTVQNEQAEGQRTDLQLELIGGIDGLLTPLVLDAKCKAYRQAGGHPDLQEDLQESARRYVRDSHGSAFLLHPCTLRAWPARSLRTDRVLTDEDFPFRHGVERLHPDDDWSLRRILAAWFILHGVIWICPSCGNNHRDGVATLDHSLPPDFTQRYPMFPVRGRSGWVCANVDCRVGTVLNRCLACKRLIVKTFPAVSARDQDNAAWLDHVEVYAKDAGRAGLRHCAGCGQTL